MKTPSLLPVIGFAAVLFAAARPARALPLPDGGTCRTDAFCFNIVQEGAGPAFAAVATSNVGAVATSTTNTGLYGESRDWRAVEGVSRKSDGVWGKTNGQFTVAGVKGVADVDEAGIGVWGTARGNGSGVYGENQSANGWAGNFNGRLWAKGGLHTPSDVRLKKDIAGLAHGLPQLLKLRPVSYRWKNADNRVHLGLIAQELRQHVPEVVDGDEAATNLSVNYPALLPVVIKAVQDQQAIIKTLEARIADLERRRQPALGSVFSGGAGPVLALALLPLGLLAGWSLRQRK
jgi:hypothetical protein